jgi:Ca2+-binding EF-hand superfamily protein
MSLRNRTLPLTTSAAIVCLLGSALALAETGTKPAGHPRGHDHHGGLFARLDANHDGKIDRAESRAAAAQHFAELDKNGDGSISEGENLGPVASGKGPNKDEHFARMDKNGDGKIARSETKMPSDHFERVDSNKDGHLTKAELEAGWQAMAAKHQAERFGELDANADGKIEKAEALAHAERLFVGLDGNKDGQVTHDEARAGLAAKRHGKGRAAHDCHSASPKTHDQPAKTSAKGQAI